MYFLRVKSFNKPHEPRVNCSDKFLKLAGIFSLFKEFKMDVTNKPNENNKRDYKFVKGEKY